MKWTPRPYQIPAVQHVLYNAGAGLFLRPGLGKTSTTLAAHCILTKEKVINGTLVIAPLRVCYSVWPREVAKWDDFKRLSVGILHGPDKAKVLRQKHDIYVINPEGLDWLARELKQAKGGSKAWPFNNLVLDESTKFKHTNTERFKILSDMLPKFARRLILTGTPVANRLSDIFGQVLVLDDGARLGKYITHFRKQYFDGERHPMGFTIWTARADTGERIRQKIEDICLYMDDRDHLKMPKLTFNPVYVTLPPAAKKVYDAVEDAFFAVYRDAKISAAHKAAARIKLKQVTGGAVYGDEGIVELHAAKVDALEDLIEESGGTPVLVAVAFKHEAERIQKMVKARFKVDAPYLGGGISPKASDRIAEDWNAGKLPVVIAHPSSVAHGLNLQAGGHTVVWFGLTDNAEEYDQLNRRVYRQGQEHPVIIHHIVIADTVDADVAEALINKEDVQQVFLNPLKRSKA